MRFRTLLSLSLFALILGACADHPQDPLQPDAAPLASEHSASVDLDNIPPRSEDLAGFWEEMSDEELWEHLAEQDGYAVMGVKNPGEPRGIWRADILTQPATMTGAKNAADAITGVEVRKEYDPFPA